MLLNSDHTLIPTDCGPHVVWSWQRSGPYLVREWPGFTGELVIQGMAQTSETAQ